MSPRMPLVRDLSWTLALTLEPLPMQLRSTLLLHVGNPEVNTESTPTFASVDEFRPIEGSAYRIHGICSLTSTVNLVPGDGNLLRPMLVW